MRKLTWVLTLTATLGIATACGDDDGSEADRLGVGAACTVNTDCSEAAKTCLLQFKGGYCGISGCAADTDCPTGSRCVAHDDNTNYCFLVCTDKTQCNVNRPVDAESNCSASVTFVEGDTSVKACIPPSGA
ncbi:MAG: hypothetical protein JRH20_20350 [Deltaproteobacteria bacterium]|nr:hypothetical protein [Deltaproteobacteria bacterium]